VLFVVHVTEVRQLRFVTTLLLHLQAHNFAAGTEHLVELRVGRAGGQVLDEEVGGLVEGDNVAVLLALVEGDVDGLAH